MQRHAVFGRRRYWLHLVLWVLVIITCFPATDGLPSPERQQTKLGTDVPVRTQPALYADAALTIPVAAVLVYTFLLLAIPYARYRQRKRVLIGSFLLLIGLLPAVVLVSAIGYAVRHAQVRQSAGAHQADYRPVVQLAFSVILVFIITASFFSLYYFIELYDQQKTLNSYRQVLAAKLEAETSFLKLQINPHFLFNSLNNIYALTLVRAPRAPVIARRLHELMHYVLQECSQETVPLEGEVDFLRNYVALEQLRNPDGHVHIRFLVSGELGGLQIAPLLLINFIENAFKHGVKSGIDRAEVHIGIGVTGRRLSMEVYNTKPAVAADQQLAIREGSGIGISNVRRRLQIMYAHQHSLQINDMETGYWVRLTAEL